MQSALSVVTTFNRYRNPAGLHGPGAPPADRHAQFAPREAFRNESHQTPNPFTFQNMDFAHSGPSEARGFTGGRPGHYEGPAYDHPDEGLGLIQDPYTGAVYVEHRDGSLEVLHPDDLAELHAAGQIYQEEMAKESMNETASTQEAAASVGQEVGRRFGDIKATITDTAHKRLKHEGALDQMFGPMAGAKKKISMKGAMNGMNPEQYAGPGRPDVMFDPRIMPPDMMSPGMIGGVGMAAPGMMGSSRAASVMMGPPPNWADHMQPHVPVMFNAPLGEVVGYPQTTGDLATARSLKTPDKEELHTRFSKSSPAGVSPLANKINEQLSVDMRFGKKSLKGRKSSDDVAQDGLDNFRAMYSGPDKAGVVEEVSIIHDDLSRQTAAGVFSQKEDFPFARTPGFLNAPLKSITGKSRDLVTMETNPTVCRVRPHTSLPSGEKTIRTNSVNDGRRQRPQTAVISADHTTEPQIQGYCSQGPTMLEQEKAMMELMNDASTRTSQPMALQVDPPARLFADGKQKSPLAPIRSRLTPHGIVINTAAEPDSPGIQIPCGLTAELDSSPRDWKVSTPSVISYESVASEFIVGSEVIHCNFGSSSLASDIEPALVEEDDEDNNIPELDMDGFTDQEQFADHEPVAVREPVAEYDPVAEHDLPKTNPLSVTVSYVSY